MSNVFVDIPDVLSKRMKDHKLINWGEILARELSLAISEREIVEQILGKSVLEEKDVEEMDADIKRSLYESHYEKD